MEKLEMTCLEKDLSELIAARRGAQNAIPRAELCALLDYAGDRSIRAAIRHLIVEHGAPICSGPGGYYTPVTPEEIESAAEFCKGYAMKLLYRASRLTGRPLMDVVGQATLSFAKKEWGWMRKP